MKRGDVAGYVGKVEYFELACDACSRGELCIMPVPFGTVRLPCPNPICFRSVPGKGLVVPSDFCGAAFVTTFERLRDGWGWSWAMTSTRRRLPPQAVSKRKKTSRK